MTTITDLHNDLNDPTIAVYRSVTGEADFGVRLVPALAAVSHTPEQAIAKLESLRDHAGDKLHYGIVKLVVDGSIQGFTARLRWPGYHNGAANGLWYNRARRVAAAGRRVPPCRRAAPHSYQR